MVVRISVVIALVAAGCGRSPDSTPTPDANERAADASLPATCSDTPANCAAQGEQATSDTYDGLLGDPTGLAAFLKNVPKGGDLHNHLSGAVYAETVLGWASEDH